MVWPIDLYAWRAELHNWYEAGLSKQAIVHISNTDYALPVVEQLNKLAETAYVIYQVNLGEIMEGRISKQYANVFIMYVYSNTL